jgi:chorismate mutase/prephenate dehydratase
MKDLDKLREEIDGIDDELLQLLNERAEKSLQVKQLGAAKSPIRRGREAEIVKRMVAANSGPFSDAAIRNIFESIVYNGRNLQGELKVAYLGPTGTYSEQAAREMFGEAAVYVPERSLREVERSLANGNVAVAVLPWENSTEGGVAASHKILIESSKHIIAEFTQEVQHALLGKGDDLKQVQTVYGHPQALAQCRDWLATHLPEARLVECASNAQGLERVTSAEDAAVASAANAPRFDMNVLATHINDEDGNATRFIALADDPVPPTGDDKTSVFCTVTEKPGALYELLGVLDAHDITMTRLESQPYGSGYGFFIDFVGHREDTSAAAALQELTQKAAKLKVLGSYPKEVA